MEQTHLELVQKMKVDELRAELIAAYPDQRSIIMQCRKSTPANAEEGYKNLVERMIEHISAGSL